MRVAQHWSLCRDDALDAYQRALEIYVRRLDSLDPATEIAWMKVVVKHEALAVRRQRAEALPVEDVDFDGRPPRRSARSTTCSPVASASSAPPRRCAGSSPTRRRRSMLKAQGLSYAEIGESLGWTYTKVNRCITEGRARFLKVYAEIEAGDECERFAPTLAALVGGTATADALLELRPHIRNCATCRATVRELHATRLGRLAALWPIPALVAPLRWVSGRSATARSFPAPGPTGSCSAPAPTSPSSRPLEGITDLYDAIAPLELPARGAAEQPGRLVELKAHAVRVAAPPAGQRRRRPAPRSPPGTRRRPHRDDRRRRRPLPQRPRRGHGLRGHGRGAEPVRAGAAPSAPSRRAEGRRRRPHSAAAQPQAARAGGHRDAGAAQAPRADATPSRAEAPARSAPTTPTTHEQPTPAPAPAGATQDFTFEQTAPAAPAAPASAPTNGGGEFAP